MSKTKDKTGERYGRLVVLRKTDLRNKSRNAIYICQCDCGNIKEIPSNVLTPTGVKSCGCLLQEAMEKHKLHLEGLQFGNLYVIEEVPSDGKYTMWRCKCICGNELIVRGTHLTYGNTTSCGCKNVERMRTVNYKDLRGEKFGKLTVIEETSERSPNGNVIWRCMCECGKETFVDSGSLQSGNTKSCGCLQSQGELKIRELLNNHKLVFKQQYCFNDCRDINPLPFDFYVNNQYLIEFDGIHHFTSTKGWNTDEKVESTQRHDKIKNNYCLENNIPLIRIPYTHYEDISIEDLCLDTSKFLITNNDTNKEGD